MAAPSVAARAGGPTRVVHIIDGLGAGGAERLLVTTVRHLHPERVRSAVVTLLPHLHFKADVERAGAAVHELGLRGALDWRRGIFALAAILRRERPHIVHTHLRFSNLYGRIAARLAGVPAVLSSLHSLEYSDWPAVTVKAKLWKQADRVTASTINAGFIAVSQAVRDDYARHLGLRNATVLHNYIDPRPFADADAATARAVREELGWTSGEFVALAVGRLAPEKGFRHLIDAVPAIAAAIPHARVLVVGDGPEGPSLRAQAAALGVDVAVRFAGTRRDIAGLMAAADCFVFPSVGEGLGIAVLEAMASALPVVAAATGGVTELIREGVDGLLVEAASPAAIAHAVTRLAADPTLRHDLGRQARATATGRFGADAGVARLEAYYDDLLASVARRTR